MKRFLRWFVFLALVFGAVGLWVTRPKTVDADAIAALTPNLENGALVFAAAGCASCHSAEGSTGEAMLILTGGKHFASDFGTFIAPNISPDETAGIGGWNDAELASAIMFGTGNRGQHLYPAFPYAAYGKAELQDVVDLIAHLRTLPTDATPSEPHLVGFPFNIRASLGGWKMLFTSNNWILDGDLSPELQRGRYLVEALGHCTECHTSRNALGGLDTSRWLAGAPHPSGEGFIPNITPGALQWSDFEIAAYLSTGFTPDFDVAGGEMVEVIANLAQLPEEDIAAITAYLQAIPAIAPLP